MKTKVIKLRSEIIRAAKSKLQAGFMKHRLEPKGGSKKEDFMKDYETNERSDEK